MIDNTKKHPHDKYIRAWLDGEVIQKLQDGQWFTMGTVQQGYSLPQFPANVRFRIEPAKGFQYTYTTGDGYIAITPRRFASIEEAAQQYPGKDLRKMDGSEGYLA